MNYTSNNLGIPPHCFRTVQAIALREGMPSEILSRSSARLTISRLSIPRSNGLNNPTGPRFHATVRSAHVLAREMPTSSKGSNRD